MAIDNITPKNTIKGWFKRGIKPMEAQFHAWMDSYWHKSEPIPTATIEGLETILNSKAETADITSIRTGMEEHANDDTRHKTATEQSKLDNLADNADATYARKVRLEDLETDMAEQDAAGLQAAKDYTDALAENVYKKAETDNKYVFKTNMPTALKNPNAITFTGAVSETYDGSVAKTVNIPVGLSLGETSTTAYRGDRGKTAYDYSQSKRSKADLDSTLQTEINSKVNTTDARLSDARLANGGNADTVGGLSADSFVRNNDGDQVMNGNLTLNTSHACYVKFNRNGIEKGYVGCGTYSSTDLHLDNYIGRNSLIVADDGKNYSNGNEIATTNQIPTTLPASDVKAWAKADTKPAYIWGEIGGKPSFAAVATSGNYNDLTNKPEIPTTETAATIMSKVNSQTEITFTKHVVCTNGAGTASTSDMRFKNNVYNLRNLLPIVVDAPLFNYTWKDEPDTLIGSSAQYWEQYLPELVYEMEDGTKTLSYERLGGVVALKGVCPEDKGKRGVATQAGSVGKGGFRTC